GARAPPPRRRRLPRQRDATTSVATRWQGARDRHDRRRRHLRPRPGPGPPVAQRRRLRAGRGPARPGCGMTLATVRYLEKFESVDGLTSYTFPIDDYEYEPAQAFRRAETPAVGADYAVDFLGAAPWPKAVGEEAVRFTIWGASATDADSQFDACVATLRRIGLGRLYQVDSATTRRWCWAKLLARPSYLV